MFLRKIKKKTKNKTYTTIYLAESYRDKDGKVRHRHLANLSKLPQQTIDAIEKALKNQQLFSKDDLKLQEGKSFGALLTVYQIAKRLGITEALGRDFQGKLALFQIAGRVICPSSRHYLAEYWRKGQAVEKVLNLEQFTVNDLYSNLQWLADNQAKIERKIFQHRYNDKPLKQVFLYDITSSYFEGDKNELAAYGYNRDKKRGKKQIVIGLLTDSDGYPVSVEVFKGNTADNTTVNRQLEKLKNRFSVDKVVFVGDKGMVKSAQIDSITSSEYGWYYITSITKRQIEGMLRKGDIQLDLFSDELVEIEKDGKRYILRRNPVRAEQMRLSRQQRIEKIKQLVERLNQYLTEHKRANVEVAKRKVEQKIADYKLKGIINVEVKDRQLVYSIDREALEAASRLDGCYVLKTNVPKEELSKEKVEERYKDLKEVEIAFRTIKTAFEQVRPIYVRKSGSTRGHVFVVALAYMIIKYIKEATRTLGYPVKYIIDVLDRIRYLRMNVADESIEILPELTAEQKQILEILQINIKKAL